MPPSAKEQ